MSDFLSNLVAKSFNLTTVVQPRTISLFEPVTMTPETELESLFDGDIAPQMSNLPLSTSAAPVSRTSLSTSQVEVSNGGNALPATTNPFINQSISNSQTTSLSSQSHADLSPVTATSNPSSHHTTAPPPLAHPAMPDSQPSLESPTHTIDAAEILLISEQTTHNLVATINPETVPLSSVSPVTATSPLPIPAPKNPSRILVQPQINQKLAVDLPQTSQQSQTTQPPLPTIQVTIGRIEVRATPPAPTPVPTAKSRPHTPAMGLAEYLRQRSGGG
ncbi:hypothetical protein A6770_22075 [Nostoc minutum NIES-26]|uniref:Uncharacterized protein n=1 Tax=Nostoc minutum NIES-26 TaxID=1844469 RepID=A0A367R0D8_9NOSO|nr:hypothetical protein A6770_22075 [Nostoc minutum NIES-26]